MLHEFLTANHQELINRCKDKAGARFEPSLSPATIDHGVPLFLQQLTGILREEQLTDERPGNDQRLGKLLTDRNEMGRSAALQGTELMRLGYTLDQVVHGYGDVCQAITTLAVEQTTPISADEFRTLNRCLDNAIADAVTAFGSAGQVSIEAQAETLSERLSKFSEEQQRLVDIAVHAYAAIKTGNVGMAGATGALLLHTLEELRALPARKLPGIRLRDPATGLAPKQKS
ncbi:MAG: hypothetical protein WD775_04540 [Burkholderiales bacterium]